MGTVLVTGGTGRLGRVLVPRLAAAGHRVRVLRHRAVPGGAEDVPGDLRTGAGLADAVAGAGTIVHCATTNGRGDVVAARRLVAAAVGSRPHLVFVSIVGIDTIPLGYYRAKLAAERVVEASGLPYTILRATQFHELVLAALAWQRWLPAVVVPGGIQVQPVDTATVADRLVELVAAPPAGRVADIGGPVAQEPAELARDWLHATGRRRPVTRLPVPGAIGAALRRGVNLAPAAGTVTFAQFLAERGR